MKRHSAIGSEKQNVAEFWNRASCGEDLYLFGDDKSSYEAHACKRYELEPYIIDFADFPKSNGLNVLEIGVGLGADHVCFASAGAKLHGVDITERAIAHARNRLSAYGLHSELSVGDAENLSFKDDFFDVVYSWGVIHHTPETQNAVAEIYRVLRVGGKARIMIYSKWSMVGLMLWLRYAFIVGRPWKSLRSVYSQYLESPGTKAYSIDEAKILFKMFKNVSIKTVLTHGDLLESEAGQRHNGIFLSFAKILWPRSFIKKYLKNRGLFMLIEAEK